MSSFLCFICHSTVNSDTNEEIREKYREVVGMHLCPDSHLCFICCHVLGKLWLFRSICLKRSLEYPVLFSEKGALYLQRNDLEIHVLCPEDCDIYHQRSNCKSYHFNCTNVNDNTNQDNEYVKLEDDNDFTEYFNQIEDHNDYETDNDVTNNVQLEKNNELDENNVFCNNDMNNVAVEKIEYNDERNELCNEEKNELCSEEKNENNNEFCENDKRKKNTKKKVFKKIHVSIEGQKAELETNRREKKYIEAEFKCYNCALSFLFKDTYQAHMMRHEESNGEFQCLICTLRFATQALLRAHSSSHTERYKCMMCKDIIKARSKKTHACVRPPETQKIACHLCGNLFKDANGLQQHLRRVHSAAASSRLTSCGVCGERYSGQALRTHMLKHIRKKFSCEICGSVFSSPYTLTQHKKKHSTPAETHYCATCGVNYNSRKSLLAHRRNSVNHQMTMLDCSVCGRACPGKRALALHMARVHEGRADHACTLCPARYSTRGGLTRHMIGHNKPQVKVAVCHLCGNNFKDNNKLNRHLRDVCEKSRFEEALSTLYDG